MQKNLSQHWLYSATMLAKTISDIDKFTKVIHPDFLVRMVVGILITQTQKMRDCW